MCDRDTVECLADVRHVRSLYVSEYHDFLFGQEVECEVVDRVSQNTLLDKNYVGTRGSNFFNQI